MLRLLISTISYYCHSHIRWVYVNVIPNFVHDKSYAEFVIIFSFHHVLVIGMYFLCKKEIAILSLHQFSQFFCSWKIYKIF